MTGLTEWLLEQKMIDDNDDDEASAPPRVIDAPAEVWLVYGELDCDTTHEDCARDGDGDVSWSEEQQYASDVRYVRADKADALRNALAVAAIAEEKLVAMTEEAALWEERAQDLGWRAHLTGAADDALQ